MKVCIKNLDTEVTKKQQDVISSFIKFLQSQIPLSSDVHIFLTNDQKTTGTTGIRKPGSKIYVLSKNRMLVDILRTISHEWVHEYQHQKLGLPDNAKIQNIGGPEENMCNILSGIFMKQFDQKNPKFREIIYEQEIINELSPNSSGVVEVLEFLSNRPEIMKQLGFRDTDSLKYFIDGASIQDFDELRDEIDELIQKKNEYIKGEMDEIERAVQDLSRDGDLETTVKDVTNAFVNGKEIKITDDIWKKLENTESKDVKKGEMKKVVEIAKKYNKTSPTILKKSLQNGDYNRPLILKFGNRYHLVAGNTRLCTAAALGMKPQVLIGEI